MIVTATDTMQWFPYNPRPNQALAVSFSTELFNKRTVGLLSADCGVGKTVAVLSGYLNARAVQSVFRLAVLIRTHSQSHVFEEEIAKLRSSFPDLQTLLTATSMVSRIHVCPLRGRIESNNNQGFLHGCAQMIKTGQCHYYWSTYRQNRDNRHELTDNARSFIDRLLDEGVVSRERLEEEPEVKAYCPYEIMRWCAKYSRIVIGPYSYLFKDRVRSSFLTSLGSGLEEVDLVIDEAHNLASHILDSETASLTGKDLRWLREHKVEVQQATNIKWLSEVIDFLWESIMLKLDYVGSSGEMELEKWNLVPRFIERVDIEQLLITTRPSIEVEDQRVPTETPFDRLVDFLYTGLRSIESDDWHASLEVRRRPGRELSLSEVRLKIRPLNAAGLTAPVLRGAQSALLMSGTLRPMKHYARLFGVQGAMMEAVGSPYPKRSRIVLVDQSLSTRYKERSTSLWRKIAERIGIALETMPSNKSALVSFPSYAILESVLSHNVHCGDRLRLIETRDARIEDLKEAIESRPHAIFCVYGGKFSEGVDLAESGSSLIDIIIGVGIPFSPPTSYTLALQNWYEKRYESGAGFYYTEVLPSIRKVAQLIGRLRRSPNDWGVVLLLDKRFSNHIHVFGEDIISDLWPYKTPDELRAAIIQYLEWRRILE